MKFLLRALFAVAAAAAVTLPLLGQTPTVITVGSQYPTIALAVSVGCSSGPGQFQVLIPAGAAPADTIASVSKGCNRTFITDGRVTPNATCQWISPSYVCTVGPQPAPTPASGSDPLGTAANLLAQYPGSAAEALGRYANSAVILNQGTFSDGTNFWTAGPIYVGSGTYIDDFQLTVNANPNAFTAAQLLNIITKFVAARSTAGDLPPTIGTNAQSTGFYSGFDSHHAHVNADPWLGVSELLSLYCGKVGASSSACATAYSATVGPLKTAMGRVPRNPTTNLMTVTAGDEYVCGSLFMEIMRNTGDVANCNVYYEREMSLLGKLATATGDTANAAFFASEQASIDAGIKSVLIDATSGLLITASGQNSGNLDVQSSALWVFSGFGTPAQQQKIATYFATNYSTLVNSQGFIRNSPTVWQYTGCIPAGGGAPYTALGTSGCYPQFDATTNYQSGYWSHDFQWFASTLALVNPALAQQMLATYASGINPRTEWYAIGGTLPGGTSPNMESPQGAFAYAQSIPPTLLRRAVPNTPGIPSLQSAANSVATFAPNTGTPQWPLNDGAFTLVLNPTASIPPSTIFATVTFGKTWATIDNTAQQYPMCSITPRLPLAAGVAIITNGGPSTITFSTGPSQTIAQGGPYAWMVTCTADSEQ